MKFNHVVCGGTFDHLHKGHKKLLEACFQSGKKISIGITSMAFARPKQYFGSMESYAIRSENLLRFASECKRDISTSRLTDIYGPTLTDGTIDAIYVTEETLIGAQMINNERIKIGMKPLSIISVPLVEDEIGEKIASSRIRQGLISREGTSYYKFLSSRDSHYMPESLVRVLRKPLGRVISSFSTVPQVQLQKMKDDSLQQGCISHISVGDVITYNLIKEGIHPSLSIIDGVTQRKALKSDFMNLILNEGYSNAPNKKGTIQKESVKAIYSLFTEFNSGHNKAIKQLFIHGEEDLLTLVAILFAPLASHVWYGQQGVGAVDVRVTEKKKQIVYNLIRQFT